MASPLSTLAKTLGSSFSGIFFAATLERDTAAAGPNAWTPGTITTTTYTCKALRDTWSAYQISGGLVAAQDAKLLVLASTLGVEPKAGDRVTIGSVTYTIVSDGGSKAAVESDPVAAVWECRGRV